MSLLFVAVFFLGLILGVWSMLNGVERPSVPEGMPAVDAYGHALADARTSLKVPTAGAALTLAGATGYLLDRYASLSTAAEVVAALAAGAVGVVLAVLVIAKWAVPAAQRDVEDERYLLQGHFARVTHPIGADETGEIAYEIDGTRYAAKARSVDGAPVEAETEVVIDRLEDGVAWVETWAVVEQRI